MPDDDQGSITRWITDVKSGDLAAAQPLWERYFERIVSLARSRLRTAGRKSHDAAADEEDAALSAFDSLCSGLARGQFPQLADRDDLWRLLVVITTRKVAAQSRRQLRQKRGAGLVKAATDLENPDSDDHILAAAVSSEPTPDFAVMVAEQYRNLLDQLGDDVLRTVAILRFEGYTTEEVAQKLGCARRTVARQLALIRRILSASVDSE